MKAAFLLLVLVLAGLPGPSPTARADDAPCYGSEWAMPGTLNGSAYPYDVEVDGSLRVLVTQVFPAAVHRFGPSGEDRQFVQWTSSGSNCFAYPFGVASAPGGRIYLADPGCSRIQVVGPDNQLLALWGSRGTGPGQFLYPFGIAIDPQGHVYVADTYAHRIQKFDSDGGYLLQWGSLGAGPGQFNTPFSLDTDAEGNVYVLDSYNQRVQVFDGQGQLLRSWGEQGFGDHAMWQPHGLDVDHEGNVLVADTERHRILKFDRFGSLLAQWGTAGNGPGQFAHPHGVVSGPDGTVYVADTQNGRIQRFAPPVVARLWVEPSTIRPRSQGRWLTASIEPPAPYGAEDIVAATLTLNGVPIDPGTSAQLLDQDGNGIEELVAKFDRSTVLGTAPSAETLPLLLQGRLADRCLVGRDTLSILGGPIAASTQAIPGSGLALEGIHPNPVRDRCSIRLRVSDPGPVRAELYDVTGRMVHASEQQVTAAGSLSFALGQPEHLRPGMYLLRIRQGARTQEARLAIVR